ncbi:MAG: 30S ribosomal protein S13 [Planctomycetota bacterium]|nr:30S ribosomal protein S13 [Planctomycetota bacterium]
MPRLIGNDIPNDKRIVVSLTYLFGIGRKTSETILRELGIDENMRAKDLTEEEVTRLSDHIDEKYTVEGTLRRVIQTNINRLKDIRCYRGLRHRSGLPVRGQRTRTNARTRKGPKRTFGGKKR